MFCYVNNRTINKGIIIRVEILFVKNNNKIANKKNKIYSIVDDFKTMYEASRDLIVHNLEFLKSSYFKIFSYQSSNR